MLLVANSFYSISLSVRDADQPTHVSIVSISGFRLVMCTRIFFTCECGSGVSVQEHMLLLEFLE